MTDDDQVIPRFIMRLQWALLLFAVGWLVWLLGPILTPFVLAALLGWLGDPLVDRLEASGRSRNTAVVLVFTAMLLLVVLALVILVPMVVDQVRTLVDSLPGYRDWLLQTVLPWIEARAGIDLGAWLDPTRALEFFREHSERATSLATTALGMVSRSGFAIVTWGVNIVLVPVVTFFFLRDWDRMVAGVASVVPRDHIDTVSRLARESSDVLGGFLRGQFLVMLILGVMYGVGLWLVGIELGLLIGLIAGLFTFVPYLGPTSGIVLGVVAALVEHGDWQHVAGVLAVFGIGQLIESYWLTPKLVGDRIGLHPVAVIFAVMAGGVLFGFVGMLIALPAAAVVNVLLRFAHERYTASRFYAGEAGLATGASAAEATVAADAGAAARDEGGRNRDDA
ncbi:AI-2E family transporter [Luteimonas granuli]|uniref:AI-2E family transporter n=1 Tax=Luteimonas granuli TaxID=1176533 RepID=A0A518N2U6_9GAMM|nr:AI-2E family transporter [Luteimonas granuli]QDW66214.1 AI-2E family transporter [Luteimonas granuli]